MENINIESYLEEKLKYSNDMNNQKLILVKQIPFGLGGQYKTRIVVLKLSILLGRRVIFDTIEDFPYERTFEDFSFSSNKNFKSKKNDIVKIELEKDQSNIKFLLFDPELWTKKLDSTLTKKLNVALYPKLNAYLTTEHFNFICFDWMPVRKDFIDKLKDDKARLSVDKSTLCVHFRRGDKKVESPYVPASEYSKKIKEVIERFKLNKIFIASDSPKAVKELDIPSGITILFDYEERRYNNANHRMLLRNRNLALQETYTTFKNINLLSSGGAILGQDNAHFAVIAADSVSVNMGKERVFLLNGNSALESNSLLAIFFEWKKRFRELLKKLFPFLRSEMLIKDNKRE